MNIVLRHIRTLGYRSSLGLWPAVLVGVSGGQSRCIMTPPVAWKREVFTHRQCYYPIRFLTKPVRHRRDSPTSRPSGFLRKPSLVCISPCLSDMEYLRAHVAAISFISISATFLPTHARGPWLKGMKAFF